MIEFYRTAIIHPLHQIPNQAPIQSIYANLFQGWLEVFLEYVEALTDCEKAKGLGRQVDTGGSL